MILYAVQPVLRKAVGWLSSFSSALESAGLCCWCLTCTERWVPPLWVPGGRGQWGPHPKRPWNNLHLGWPFAGWGFVIFIPRLPASRHREQTNSAASWGGARMWMWGAGISVAISRAGCGGCFRALYLLSGWEQITETHGALDVAYPGKGCSCQARGYFLKRADAFAYAEEC